MELEQEHLHVRYTIPLLMCDIFFSQLHSDDISSMQCYQVGKVYYAAMQSVTTYIHYNCSHLHGLNFVIYYYTASCMCIASVTPHAIIIILISSIPYAVVVVV